MEPGTNESAVSDHMMYTELVCTKQYSLSLPSPRSHLKIPSTTIEDGVEAHSGELFLGLA